MTKRVREYENNVIWELRMLRIDTREKVDTVHYKNTVVTLNIGAPYS